MAVPSYTGFIERFKEYAYYISFYTEKFKRMPLNKFTVYYLNLKGMKIDSLFSKEEISRADTHGSTHDVFYNSTI